MSIELARNRLVARLLTVRLARSLDHIDGRTIVEDALKELPNDALDALARAAAEHPNDPARAQLAAGAVVINHIRRHATLEIGTHAIADEAKRIQAQEAPTHV
ncbi:hypothetical protein JN531_003880 [Flagellatimonas centrodinii]|uniref:hypothetical protein n=1 Tax=Flagellatimonas centrodinii TaxID=2806210 RepID=UPI001FEE2202|nr:hypothetical protein [Flagellatimonas centrodinii]ULQ47427.1 hypothetical protein JN531_003880 [Flagellatimonas centrodinii]